MSTRWALVIGSQCDALNELTFLPGAARNLAQLLHDPQRGQWRAALDDTSWLDEAGALLDPTANRLQEALRHAFIRVAREGGRLLIAFIGHGVAPHSGAGSPQVSDLFLMAKDSPANPSSQTALNIGNEIRDALLNLPGLDPATISPDAQIDGLALLIDACQTGAATHAAATRWVEVIGERGGRLDVLVATGHDNAYQGCFTTTLCDVLTQGVPAGAETLRASDLVTPIDDACAKQKAEHLAYTAGAKASQDQQDAGLWLSSNPARPPHVLTGTSAAGLIEQVTRGVLFSPGQRRQADDLQELGPARLRAVLGPAGSGKTTVMATLIRPDARNLRATLAIAGAVFLDRTSTPESVAADLNAQLRRSVPGFEASHNAVLAETPPGQVDDRSAPDRDLLLPLRRRNTEDLLHLVIDGIEQVDPTQQPAVLALVAALSDPDDTALDRVRVILGARTSFDLASQPGLGHVRTVTLPAPRWADVAAAITNPTIAAAVPDTDTETPGGWLTLRIAAAITQPPTSFGITDLARAYLDMLHQTTRIHPDQLTATLLILAAAGTGPTLPIRVLQRALHEMGHPQQLADLRTTLTALGPLVQRGNPGQPDEHAGLAHAEITHAITNTRDDTAA